jgi:hypothetical protein
VPNREANVIFVKCPKCPVLRCSSPGCCLVQNLPFCVAGVGDMLALFRCISCRYCFGTDIEKPALLGAPGRVLLFKEVRAARGARVCLSWPCCPVLVLPLLSPTVAPVFAFVPASGGFRSCSWALFSKIFSAAGHSEGFFSSFFRIVLCSRRCRATFRNTRRTST